jgi:hypothetical protein
MAGVREYAVSPVLVSNLPWQLYEKRRKMRELEAENAIAPAPLSWSELRVHNLLDSGISGALTGGLFNMTRSAYVHFILCFYLIRRQIKLV